MESLNLEFTKTGIRELTNEAYNRTVIDMVQAVAKDAVDLVETHGQDTARKVGEAVTRRMISQTMSEHSGAIVAAFGQAFEAELSEESQED